MSGHKMKRYVLIPAGGTGSRMGANMPKQFLPLAGKPIIVHTIQKFLSAVPDMGITIALPKEYFNEWNSIQEKYLPAANIQITHGGATRFHSIKNGLSLLPDEGVVALHDAVRPFVSKQLIMDCFTSAEKYGSGVAAILPKDSLFKMGKKIKSKDRNDYRLAQTPQTFLIKQLKKVYNCEYKVSFTDDASVWEAGGKRIHLVEGEYSNFKITTKEDLLAAEMMMMKG